LRGYVGLAEPELVDADLADPNLADSTEGAGDDG
jgi:hypothetical protein